MEHSVTIHGPLARYVPSGLILSIFINSHKPYFHICQEAEKTLKIQCFFGFSPLQKHAYVI